MKKRRIIFSSICVILLVALVGGTLAWFYLNEEVTISYGNSIFCEAGDSLEISLVEKGATSRWTSVIDYRSGEFTTVDISGDGKNLYRPAEIDENQQPVGFNQAESSLSDGKTYDYVELEVAFRSLSKMNVYLSDESFILPVDPTDTTSNIYGNFSRDYIAGAMRVAVLEGDEVKMLWAPNSRYQLIQNANGSYSFNSGDNGNSVPESSYSYFAENEDGELVQTIVSSEEYASKRFVVDATGANKYDSGNSAVLVSLNPASEGSYDQKNVKIRIWFEGTDREAHQALAGGNVNVKLKFVGISKETDAEKQAAIDSITFNEQNSTFGGVVGGMVFSTDGRNWTTANSAVSNLPKLQEGQSIYFKYPETDTTFETNYKMFTKVDQG